VHEQRGDGGIARRGAPPRTGGERQDMGDVLPAVAGAQRYGDALGADGGVAAASDGKIRSAPLPRRLMKEAGCRPRSTEPCSGVAMALA
jgi:hypothetical protein